MRFSGFFAGRVIFSDSEWLSAAAEGCASEISGKLICDPAFIALNSSLVTPKPDSEFLEPGYECGGRNALHLAALNGEAGVCEVLLKCRADVNKLDDCKESPLSLAARAQSLECVKVLLDYNAAIAVEGPHK
jgi:ankyrin repeat protein